MWLFNRINKRLSSTVIAIFVPKEDITTYELAYIMGHISFFGVKISIEGLSFSTETWNNLEHCLKRHFVIKDV